MLMPDQQKLIRKYAILPQLIIPSFFLVFLGSAVAVVLITIDGAFLRNLDMSTATIMLAGSGSFFYGFFVLYILFVSFSSLRSEKWITLVKEVAARNGLTPYTDDQYEEKIKILCGQPAMVAELARVELPSFAQSLKWLIIIPITAQVLLFVPEFISSHNALEAQKDVVSHVLEQLDATYAPNCTDVRYSHPRDGFRHIYNFYAYLNETEEHKASHINIAVDEDSRIHEISYYCDVDVHLSKEENIAHVKESFEKLHEMLVASGVTTSSKTTMDLYQLSDEFCNMFTEGSYYEEFILDNDDYDDAYVYYRYDTRSEEEYTDYARSYVSLHLSTKYSLR